MAGEDETLEEEEPEAAQEEEFIEEAPASEYDEEAAFEDETQTEEAAQEELEEEITEEEADDELPFEPASSVSAPDPMKEGPFPVGVKTVDFFDDTRPKSIGGPPRFLRTEIWYPAVQSAKDGTFVSYDVRVEGVDPNIDLGDKAQDLANTDIGLFKSKAVRDSLMDVRYAPYPVIFFSHGSYSARFQYNFITNHLASHGYIVVAADHSGNTLWDMIRDGFNFINMASSIADRATDMAFLFDRMKELNEESGGFFENAMKLEKAGLCGHSLGGFTVLLTHSRAPARYRNTVALSPVLNSYYLQLAGLKLTEYAGIALIMSGTDDKTVSYKEQYCGYRSIASPFKFLYEVTNGGHFTFSDMCEINLDNMPKQQGAPDIKNDGCNPEINIPYETAQLSIKHYATAMFNFHLRDSANSMQYLAQFQYAPFDKVKWYVGPVDDWPAFGGCGLPFK